MKRISLLLLAAVICSIAATSCRTFRGFGQDVEHVGSHIENASR